MSLFSGITFTSNKAKALAEETASAQSAASASASTSASAFAASSSGRPTAAAPTTVSNQTAQQTAAPVDSAVLKFAPRINKPKPGPPRPSVYSAAVYSAPPTTAYSGIVREAAPVLIVPPPGSSSSSSSTAAAADSTGVKEQEVVLDADGRPLTRAPAMTIAAAERGTGGLKRDRGKNDGQKKKKKKKKRQQQQVVIHTFQPDEDYDPNKPNDLGEYQHYRHRLREERRERLLEEKRRKAEGGSDDSSYYTDSSDDAPRRDAPRVFAPPKALYSPPSKHVSVPREQPPPPPPAGHAPPPPPPPSRDYPPPPPPHEFASTASSGDDAYARRLAMSQASTGDDAYARRLALSQAQSGDDAYARRAALSQQPPQQSHPPGPPLSSSFHATGHPPPTLPPFPPAPPAFQPPPAHLVAGSPSGVPPLASTSFRPPPGSIAPVPPPSFSPTQPMPSFTPAPTAVSSATVGGVDHPGDYARILEEKRRAAAAIAERFKALVSPAPPAPTMAPPEEEDQSGTFAERMMRKWGHKEGQGLGVHGTGIIHALSAEHETQPAKPVDPSVPLSKRARAKQKAAAANAKNRKWVQAPSARGRIVNANETERQKEELARLGEASRIVVLTGIVDSEEDVDEELSEEIGEECSNHGIVERVVLHMVEPPPPDPVDCLRVFVVFSGMAGAWRATRELDGRFFGGKKIRARYFDETKFDAGDRDGEL